MFNKKLIIFHTIFLILLILVNFHFFQPGIWAFLDVDPWGRLLFGTNDFKITPFYIISTGSSYFGENIINYSSALLGHIFLVNFFINIFGLNIAQLLYYISFFVLNYIIGYKIIKLFDIYFNRENDINIYGITALIVTFNPITLWLMWNTMYLYTYTAFLIIFYSLFSLILLKRNNNLYYLFILLGLYLVISYPRIGFVLLAYLGLFFIFFINLQNLKKYLYLLFYLIISPILYIGFIDQYESGKNYINTTVGNNESWYYNMYGWAMHGSGLKSTALFPPDQLKMLYSGEYYISTVYGFILMLLLILFLFYKKQSLKKIDYVFLLGFFLIILQQNIVPLLKLDLSTYKFILESKFTFLFFDQSAYRFILIIPLIFFLYILYKPKYELYYFILSIILIYLTLYPLYFYNLGYKFKNISIDNFDINYQQFISNNKEPSLYIQNEGNLYFNKGFYPFNPYFFGGYKNLFTRNPRIVGLNQQKLFDQFKNLNNNIENSSLFNLKNIFVFKDIINASEGQFDFFPVKDYVGESKIYYDKFIDESNLYIKQDNENFAQFGLKNDDKYEYKIYSPAKIIPSEIDTFFETKIDIYDKPLLVDSKSFQKIENIENFIIPKENQNIKIDVKESILNPTKYYLKLSNLDTTKPFLLQLNQTFGMSWKIKWVDKSYFDEKSCIDDYKNYSITKNSVCNYDSKLLELEDVRLLGKPEVNNKNHFEGNFVGNTWLVKPEDIPSKMKSEKELYAVIIYEKQIYYSYALIISGLTFLILIILTIIQEIKNFLLMRRK